MVSRHTSTRRETRRDTAPTSRGTCSTALLPDRRSTVTFRPEFSPKLHPAVLWNEYGECLSLDDPELGLSEELQRGLTAWETTEDWASRKPKLNARARRSSHEFAAELPDGYDLVDDWRRD